MLASTQLTQGWAAAYLLLFFGSIVVQVWLARYLAEKGGRVETEQFRMPDALVATVLITLLMALGLFSLLADKSEAKPLKMENIVSGAAMYPIIALGIAGFLKARGANLISLFGLNRQSLWRVLGWAMLLFLAAYPVIQLAARLTQALVSGAPEPQELVKLFSEISRDNNYDAIIKIFVVVVVLAPICEELLFRGFFYPLGKRYCGAMASGFFTSVLFGVVHANVPTIAPLTALAICLNVAYERTGSLLVPITMHAMFNLLNLSLMYLIARGIISPL